MQTAPATTRGPWRARIALSALVLATSIAVAGCSAAPAPTASPAVAEEPPAEAPATSDGYVYEDTAAGYAVTFPGEPEVGQLTIDGTDRTANLAGYSDEAAGTFHISRGEIREAAVDLRAELFQWLGSVDAGPIGAHSDELAGLPALRAELTVQGQDATTIVAGEGLRFYQLIVAGGTPEDRQAFIDSFELLD